METAGGVPGQRPVPVEAWAATGKRQPTGGEAARALEKKWKKGGQSLQTLFASIVQHGANPDAHFAREFLSSLSPQILDQLGLSDVDAFQKDVLPTLLPPKERNPAEMAKFIANCAEARTREGHTPGLIHLTTIALNAFGDVKSTLDHIPFRDAVLVVNNFLEFGGPYRVVYIACHLGYLTKRMDQEGQGKYTKDIFTNLSFAVLQRFKGAMQYPSLVQEGMGWSFASTTPREAATALEKHIDFEVAQRINPEKTKLLQDIIAGLKRIGETAALPQPPSSQPQQTNAW